MERTIWENIMHSLDTEETAKAQDISPEQRREIARKNAELTRKLRDQQGLKEGDLRWAPIKTKK